MYPTSYSSKNAPYAVHSESRSIHIDSSKKRKESTLSVSELFQLRKSKTMISHSAIIFSQKIRNTSANPCQHNRSSSERGKNLDVRLEINGDFDDSVSVYVESETA